MKNKLLDTIFSFMDFSKALFCLTSFLSLILSLSLLPFHFFFFPSSEIIGTILTFLLVFRIFFLLLGATSFFYFLFAQCDVMSANRIKWSFFWTENPTVLLIILMRIF